jgi:hypothetical protein
VLRRHQAPAAAGGAVVRHLLLQVYGTHRVQVVLEELMLRLSASRMLLMLSECVLLFFE